MAKRQASASAQKRSSSHSISTLHSKADGGRSLSPRAEKQTTSTRPKVPQLLDGSSGRQQSDTDSLSDEASPDPAQPRHSNRPSLKRKRGQQASYSSPPAQEPLSSKQQALQGQSQETENHNSTTVASPIHSWVLNGAWPSEYFEADTQPQEELLEQHSWPEVMAQPSLPVQYAEINGFRYPVPGKKMSMSLRRKQSDSSLGESSNQQSRDGKSTPYRNPRYATLLELKGVFLRDFGNDDPPTSVTNPGLELLSAAQSVPQDSLFRDDIFGRFCREIQDRNEAMLVQDLTRLLVPSAKNLAIYGDQRLDILIENVNESWTECIPIEGPRPQPDYSVGFRRSAFTHEQLQKLDPLVGTVFDTSFFVATFRMYFPFLTCEVKCGAAGLDIADRQNAHSATIAVRSVVELYRAVKREEELDREILAFSISHDHRAVRIYGHYPVIHGNQVTFHRHPIHEFSFVAMNGSEKWTTYKFTRNVYDIWMPTHLKRICSAVEQLPSGLNFQVTGSEILEATDLSQDMESIASVQHVENMVKGSKKPRLGPRGAAEAREG